MTTKQKIKRNEVLRHTDLHFKPKQDTANYVICELYRAINFIGQVRNVTVEIQVDMGAWFKLTKSDTIRYLEVLGNAVKDRQRKITLERFEDRIRIYSLIK